MPSESEKLDQKNVATFSVEKVEIKSSSCDGSSVMTENGIESAQAISTSDNHTVNHVGHVGWRRYLGMILTTLSALTFSLNALILKLLNHFHPFNLGVWTFLLMVLFSLIGIVWRKYCNNSENSELVSILNTKTVTLLWLRAFLGVSALILFFYAMKFMDVADALLIDSTSPIFIHLFAYVLLKEKCGLGATFSTILAIFGIILITRPPLLTGSSEYNGNSLIGSILAFGCMMCITLAIIVLKFLEKIPQSTVNLVLGCWGLIQCLIISLWLDVLRFPNELEDAWKILATAILFFLGQALITFALQYEEAGAVGLLRTTEVFFAFVWQFIFLNVTPDIYSIFGAIFIMSGVFITLFIKWRNSPRTDQK